MNDFNRIALFVTTSAIAAAQNPTKELTRSHLRSENQRPRVIVPKTKNDF